MYFESIHHLAGGKLLTNVRLENIIKGLKSYSNLLIVGLRLLFQRQMDNAKGAIHIYTGACKLNSQAPME